METNFWLNRSKIKTKIKTKKQETMQQLMALMQCNDLLRLSLATRIPIRELMGDE